MWKDVTLHIWIWISTFKGTGNLLPKHCNRLQLFEINWNVVNSIWKLFQNNFATGNRLQQSGNRLPESKNSLVNMFFRKTMCYSIFEKNLFILILIKPSLDSWILSLESWSWFLRSWTLNLEFFLILILNSWIVLDSLELFFDWSLIHLSCSLIDLWAFCHHLCHHLLLSSKRLWITSDSPWSFASTKHVYRSSHLWPGAGLVRCPIISHLFFPAKPLVELSMIVPTNEFSNNPDPKLYLCSCKTLWKDTWKWVSFRKNVEEESIGSGSVQKRRREKWCGWKFKMHRRQLRSWVISKTA